MQYTNVKLPYDVAALNAKDSVAEVIRTLVGHDCEYVLSPGFQSVGTSPYGPYDEGDIDFVDDGKRLTLSYDFMDMGDTARIFRFAIYED